MKLFLVALVAIVVTFFFVRIFEAENIDWSEYEKRIEVNEKNYDSLSQKIDTLNTRLNITYEKIDSASKPVLRNMFNNFASRTKGHNLPRGK